MAPTSPTLPTAGAKLSPLLVALTPLALAATLALLPSTRASAQTAPVAAVAPKVVISATRVETPEDEVPATVTSKTQQEIDRALARDLKTLLDDEPGISVRLQPARMSAVFGATGRGGNEGINIRGLEGNQVLMQTDGVRLPMVYDSGPFVAGRGDYIDIEAYKRVELLRGPSSTSFGSDGLAGAVSFVTKDPSDLLTLGKDWQGSLKVGYSSADEAWLAVPSFAIKSGRLEAMLLASVRRGHEVENMGRDFSFNWNRTAANPQDRESNYLLGKLLYRFSDAHLVKATMEKLDREINTTPIYTVVGMPSVNANIIDADAKEAIERKLGKLEYQYNDPRNALFQRAQAHVWVQDAENRQFGTERYRSPPAAWAQRDRDTRYGEQGKGLGAQVESNFGNTVAHKLLLGFDLSDTAVTSLKDGAHYTAAGALIPGGFVPNQSFPDTDYRLLGAFVQDEISIGNFSLMPALRFDRFELKPERGNPLYTVNNRTEPSDLSGDELSPRLGVIWKLAPLAQVYAQYGHGFRAPTPGQVNGGVTNSTANPPYRSIGNPDLKPETSNSIEVGLRGRSSTLRYSIALYQSRYRNFIDANVDVTDSTSVPLDPGMAPTTRTFQSVNLRRAEVQGIELSAAWSFLPGWTLEGRYAHAKGDATSASVETPMATIEPDKAVIKLAYERKGVFGSELSFVGQKRQSRPHAANLYIPGGYVVADLSAWWDVTRQLQLTAALTNLGDKRYVLWSDVRGLGATTTLADAYTQPGRGVAVSARYQF